MMRSDDLRITDQFGWHPEIDNPGHYDVPAFRPYDVVNQTSYGSQFTTPDQPELSYVGPVHGASVGSPWWGNANPVMLPQVDEKPTNIGPVIGGTSGPLSWRQWLAAVEVPDSTVASQTFAAVREFPYAFKG